jgi:hypothetical protein
MLGIEGERRPAWVMSLRVENGGGDGFGRSKVICGERRDRRRRRSERFHEANTEMSAGMPHRQVSCRPMHSRRMPGAEAVKGAALAGWLTAGAGFGDGDVRLSPVPHPHKNGRGSVRTR